MRYESCDLSTDIHSWLHASLGVQQNKLEPGYYSLQKFLDYTCTTLCCIGMGKTLKASFCIRQAWLCSLPQYDWLLHFFFQKENKTCFQHEDSWIIKGTWESTLKFRRSWEKNLSIYEELRDWLLISSLSTQARQIPISWWAQCEGRAAFLRHGCSAQEDPTPTPLHVHRQEACGARKRGIRTGSWWGYVIPCMGALLVMLRIKCLTYT